MLHMLKARTINSKKAIAEIKNILPIAASYRKLHVPGIGYTLYVQDADNNVLAHCYKERGQVVLHMKK